MAEIKNKYGTSSQAITITLNSLVNDGKRESTAVDNSTSLFLDAVVQVKIATNASNDSTGDKSVYIYAYGTADGGQPTQEMQVELTVHLERTRSNFRIAN